MNRRANSDSIPMDLITDLLSRLPAKSIGRFRSVSKLWDSILRRPYFTELFLTRSSSNPRLLIAVREGKEWFFFSTPQSKNPYEKSSLVVTADFHIKLSKDKSLYDCSYASGLIYFPNMRISKENNDEVRVVCNPSIAQYAILPPDPSLTYKSFRSFLGFDPIGKHYKVLVMNNKVNDGTVYHILTLGTEKVRWRKIQCPFSHFPSGKQICINGVLYYLAEREYQMFDEVMVCFDVRSEKFKIIHLNSGCFRNRTTKLVNYKSKLGVINLEYDYNGGFSYQLFMWILVDLENQTWSTYVYTFKTENNVFKVNNNLSVVGATARGEIVLRKHSAVQEFYVIYFNPERNTLRRVEIQGVRKKDKEWFRDHSVHVFLDHVEDLQFNTMKTTYAATSIR